MKDSFLKGLKGFSTSNSSVYYSSGPNSPHRFFIFIYYASVGALFQSGVDAHAFPCWKELRGQAEQLLHNLKFYNFPFIWFITDDGIVRIIFLDSRRVHMIASLLKLGHDLPVDFLLDRLLSNLEAWEAFLLALGFSHSHAVIALGATPDSPWLVLYAPRDVCHRLLPAFELSTNHICLYHIPLTYEACEAFLQAALRT
jgi:hypothetical protein